MLLVLESLGINDFSSESSFIFDLLSLRKEKVDDLRIAAPTWNLIHEMSMYLKGIRKGKSSFIAFTSS